MKTIAITASILVLLLASGRSSGQAQEPSSSSASSPEPPRQLDFRERYQILTDRNIFLRNRARPPVRTPTTGPFDRSSTQAARRPEQSYLLTGIILEEGRRVAFIENTTTGSTERLAVGASIARGTITDVDFHSLEFESASGERTKVEIGKTLAGGDRSSAAAASTQPSGGDAPIDPNNPNLSAIERLKLRRQQDLGR